MNTFVFRALAALVLVFATSMAWAQTATTTFDVNAVVNEACLVEADNLDFGVYAPDGTIGGNEVPGTSELRVRCTDGTPFDVGLNGGTTAGGSIAQRLLTSGADFLAYNLFTDAAHSTVWGDGTTGVDQPGIGAGLSAVNTQTFTVHGLLADGAANQDVSPGNYSDQITVTVSF